MQTISNGYRGLSLLLDLNLDRLFSVVAIGGALMAGAYLGSIL
ncbi:hypothetical protein [Actibacterium lipolyticum]|uniref:Uncharacterized protein n=1 Tax=Actibacterium lipolyticum TaxID=1524263 RepID=A0A238JWC2_9RHOB|nr:hypothetical protein [Actibacterium lipolyticum]SMX34950.1 hypothetical protein COL8621_01573 [Actibacterium lipolyticum]